MESFVVQCPYCGESMDIDIEPDVEGSMVYDCHVCCQPWDLYVARQPGEVPCVSARRGQ